MSIVVIGFGNTLRGDDALGPVAARKLEARFGDDGVQVFELQP
jgi:Ni,Fe-hydrogenase maturation factor